MTRKQVFGAICLAGVLLFALSFAGCGKGGAKGLSETRDVLGTKVTISIFDQGMKAGDAKSIFDESFNLMADWQKKTLDPGDGNQVFGLSKGAGTQSIPVDPSVFEMLMKALRLYDQTGKIFDIRYGPMLDIWGFDSKPRVPAPAELDTAKKLVADGGMFIAGNSILLARKGMRFDVREIAVGHAFDMVANKLAERGIRTASITSPRIFRAIGDPPNKRGFEVEDRESHQGRTAVGDRLGLRRRHRLCAGQHGPLRIRRQDLQRAARPSHRPAGRGSRRRHRAGARCGHGPGTRLFAGGRRQRRQLRQGRQGRPRRQRSDPGRRFAVQDHSRRFARRPL